jgi:tRNA (guanine-N7-)-methyltransferase
MSPSPVRRPAASFKVRRRSLSPKRQAEFETWIERWGLDVTGPPLEWNDVFPDRDGLSQRVVLDIGFGHGESTVAMAAAEPDLDVIGVEVHTPGVVTVLDAIENQGLHQIRVVHGDVLSFLDRVPDGSLAGIRVFFPDPWTKRRNRHRRLIAPDVVTALTDRLGQGGWLHLATDITDYAAAMQAACDAEPRLAGGVVDRPEWRPLTRFEQRGLDAGRTATDLVYTRAHDLGRSTRYRRPGVPP